MFESAELGHTLDRAAYAEAEPALRQALLAAQYALGEQRRFSVVILASGIDGAGRREAVNLLNAWMDPRQIESHGMGEPSDEEREQPPMWRFWRRLPAKGKTGIFLGTWYTAPLLERAMNGLDAHAFHEQIEDIARFERMLTDEGVLVIKLWFHLSKARQKQRLKKLEEDPQLRWRVTERDWQHFNRYDDFHAASEQFVRITSTVNAPWHIIDGSDVRYRSITMGGIVLSALQMRLDQEAERLAATQKALAKKPAKAAPVAPILGLRDNLHILSALDLRQGLSKKDYDQQLEALQGRLNILTRHPSFNRISVVMLFEGNDAAGKSGAIRRVTGAIDARYYHIVPIVAPTDEERAHPYLWRFWRQLPRRGRFAIFDRSWYGRVLVERIEGFCRTEDWSRAYGEINDFEDQMVRHHTVVLKFWLAISKDEQLTRFKQREATEFKQYKITDEDWRNRDRWDDYVHAVCDMVERTSTAHAPWTLVEANDKYFACVKVLTTLCERIEAELKRLTAQDKGKKRGKKSIG
ncbi:MAG: polyphosphate:AMP phosphotransferase [Betaproteobacteria bacterium]|nr:MAG: polyphosphate:AMP phosphotransferase [Betaproteobacteria bacterium]